MTIQICASWRRLTHTRTRARASIHHTRDRARTHMALRFLRACNNIWGGALWICKYCYRGRAYASDTAYRAHTLRMLAVASLPARLTLRISSSSSSPPSSTSSSSSSSSQDGTKSPVAAQQAKGLILHIPASEKDLVAAVEGKFVAAAAAAGGRWNGPPSIWCKLRDVRLQELSGGAGGRAGVGGGTKVIGLLATDARLNCKPSVVMLPVCHSSVVEIAAALKVSLCECVRAPPAVSSRAHAQTLILSRLSTGPCMQVSLKHEAQQLEAAVASAHSAHGAAGPASARAGVGGSAAAPAQNTRASAQGAAPAAAAAAAVSAQQNGGRASDKRKAAEAGLADGPQRGRGGGAAKGGRGAA